MPDLLHSLQGRDYGFLRMAAHLWGIELNAPDAYTALGALVQAMLEPGLANEMLESLPGEAHRALLDLAAGEGRLPWSIFTRRYGALREMGPARRDRERPDLNPLSPVEVLWYRGWIGRAFLKTEEEPVEFAYIPDEFLSLLPAAPYSQLPGRPASPLETSLPQPARDWLLDEICTLLAALRLNLPNWDSTLNWRLPPPLLLELLSAAGLTAGAGVVIPEPAGKHLEAPRSQALLSLVQAWVRSEIFNELRLMPGLICQGAWQNNPLQTRQILLDWLAALPGGVWWSLEAFISSIRQHAPDFQRPAGDYDSWLIRRASDDAPLNGLAHWDEVDGALMRFIITTLMPALGLVDLCRPGPDQPPSAFRLSAWAADMLAGRPPEGLAVETASVHIHSDGRIRLTALTPRAVRYQVARFCQWEGEKDGEIRFRLTTQSLERARDQQSLRVDHFITLLRKHAEGGLPVKLLKGIKQWEQKGTQAVFDRVYILRTTSPEILNALREGPAGRFLGDPLNQTCVMVKPQSIEKLTAALLESGYLAEVRFDN
ncbi:MAG TPA: hypothetical protein PKW33_21325 [Anaerolineaceae bacterium]|nr:hypothetical protein [Anaerolineaceae bacterium]HPN54150.1 hypothetical protein [Anaerolineaceae bacterium]